MSPSSSAFVVRFWGVRGSIPCPGAATVRYGGNTLCVEMLVGPHRLIFDGGTGLRVLGERIADKESLHAHLFFSHTHWDHIQGFPFFAPAYRAANRFDIYGAVHETGLSLHDRLTDQMRHPNFPVPLREMGADLRFHDLTPGETVRIDDVEVETAPLNHPGGCLGYRVAWRGCVAAYLVDTEHDPDHPDESVLRLAQGADLIIYDATYTDAEYCAGKAGWGHSTWQEAVRIAQTARAKRLAIIHHEPSRDDAALDAIGEQLAEAFPDSLVAREGLAIELGHAAW